MAAYIKCRKENGFFLFDTLEKYPENIADEILDEFVKQDLEAIIYKSSDDPLFQVTGRISEKYVNLILSNGDSTIVPEKIHTITNTLESRIHTLLLSGWD